MLEPLNRALTQIDDPAFLGVVWRSVALSALGFVLLGAGVWWAAGQMLPGWLGSLLGLVVAGFAGLVLFVPLAMAIAGSFVDRIAGAVERRHYPWLPTPRPEALGAQVWDGIALAARVLALQGVALGLSILLPGVGIGLGWLITAWAIGRGLFVAVAMRRMDRQAAMAAYRARRWAVIAQGGAIAFCTTLPLVNLIAPVFGIAALTHVLHRNAADGGLSPVVRL